MMIQNLGLWVFQNWEMPGFGNYELSSHFRLAISNSFYGFLMNGAEKNIFGRVGRTLAHNFGSERFVILV